MPRTKHNARARLSPAPPTGLWLGSSLLQLTEPLAGVRTVSIRGGTVPWLKRWLTSGAGMDVLESVDKVLLLVGGNSLANRAPHLIMYDILQLLRYLRTLSPKGDSLRIAIGTLPPRPQIDNDSRVKDSRKNLNELIRKTKGIGKFRFEISEMDKAFKFKIGQRRSAFYDFSLLNHAERFRGAVHPTKQGAARMTAIASHFFGKAAAPAKRVRHQVNTIRKHQC